MLWLQLRRHACAITRAAVAEAAGRAEGLLHLCLSGSSSGFHRKPYLCALLYEVCRYISVLPCFHAAIYTLEMYCTYITVRTGIFRTWPPAAPTHCIPQCHNRYGSSASCTLLLHVASRRMTRQCAKRATRPKLCLPQNCTASGGGKFPPFAGTKFNLRSVSAQKLLPLLLPGEETQDDP